MHNRYCLTSAEAQMIVASCKVFAANNKWNISIAVVDEGGFLIHLERLDGAVLQSPDIATLKARTAAICRTPTKTLEEVVKDRPATATFPGRLSVQGGVPIIFRGQCIGGIGVSGVKSHEDELVALAGLSDFERSNAASTDA
jgi:glc operon protein GlcG